MGKPIAERASALLNNNDATITDLRAILPEVRKAIERAAERERLAAIESVDLALSAADRDEAAANAERSGRTARAYAKAVVDLEAKLAAKLESESRKAKEAEKAAALAERDQLAEQFAAIVRPMCEALPVLFATVLANAERMKRAGLKGEPDAELHARGILATGYVPGAYTPVDRFAQMKVPAWSAKGRCWPPEKRVDMDAQVRDARRQAKAIAAAREAEWGWYRLSPVSGCAVSFRHRAAPGFHDELERGLYREPWEGQIKLTEAERLQGLGVGVEPIDAPAETEVAE